MAENVATQPALEQIWGFRFGAVPETQELASVEVEAAVAETQLPKAELGALARFVGTFEGTGLNTIFRPQSTVTPTKLEKPAHGNPDNILEINLTTETLSFSPALGEVPNRGSGDVQGDVFLDGVPYVQSINDVTDPSKPVGIHFEPGIFLTVPATKAPAERPSIARMASIPHGTTINAQGTSSSTKGGPRIDPVDITPFPIGGDQKKNRIPFPSQTAKDDATFRLPQDLTKFMEAGTITQKILDDPNTVIRDRAARQNITHTEVITIATPPAAPLFGGGNANIAFLLGDQKVKDPNADAVSMTATFWVETVRETITVPPLTPGRAVIVTGDQTIGNPVPRFSVSSATERTQPTQAEVFYTQIQYTQNVMLNFSTLSWPHVSVATLIPNAPIPITLP